MEEGGKEEEREKEKEKEKEKEDGEKTVENRTKDIMEHEKWESVERMGMLHRRIKTTFTIHIARRIAIIISVIMIYHFTILLSPWMFIITVTIITAAGIIRHRRPLSIHPTRITTPPHRRTITKASRVRVRAVALLVQEFVIIATHYY